MSVIALVTDLKVLSKSNNPLPSPIFIFHQFDFCPSKSEYKNSCESSVPFQSVVRLISGIPVIKNDQITTWGKVKAVGSLP